MINVEIYTKATCPYCMRAKKLLTAKGVKFQEIAIDDDPLKREEMIRRSTRSTVPQIFINGKAMGGCDDIYALDAAGKLDALLIE